MFGASSTVGIFDARPALLVTFGNVQDVREIGEADLPNNLFPFPRLASVTLPDQSATFIYHQINGTTFAEEQWDNLHLA